MPLVYLILRGGLGTQLFGYSKGLLEASRLNATLVLDGTGRYSDASRRCWLRAFRLKSPVRTIWWVPPEPQSSPLLSTAMSGPRVLVRRCARAIFGPGSSGFRLGRAVLFLDGHFEIGENAVRAREAGLLTGARLAREGPMNALRVRGVEPADIAIHVRLGDFRSHSHGRLLLGARFYENALAVLGGAEGRIRIFSDEPDAAKDLIASISDVPAERLLLHEPLTPPEELAFYSAHSRLVVSNSTFSWWGAFCSPSRP